MNFASVQDAAAERSLSHWTIRQWLSKGKLKRYKLGGRTLVDRTELDAMVRLETPKEAKARVAKRTRSRGTAK